MLVLVSLFAPLGRMSLTSYVMQSLIGSTLYHGFGFALYKVTGSNMSLAIGVTLAGLPAARSGAPACIAVKSLT